MSYCLMFCGSDEQAQYVFDMLHEPLRKMVRKSGWYIDVYAHDETNLMVWLKQKWPNAKNGYRFDGTVDNISLLLQQVENKFMELTAVKFENDK